MSAFDPRFLPPPGGPPRPSSRPSHGADGATGGLTTGASTTVNTMSPVDLRGRGGGPGLTPLTIVIALVTLVGSFVVVVLRWRAGAATALEDAEACAGVLASCLVADPVREAVLDPLLIGAATFSLSIGAFVDARRRPLTGLLLAVAALLLVIVTVTA